jgi:ribonuclease HI
MNFINIAVYTDGSCIHNANVSGVADGPGGYAATVYIENNNEPHKIITGGVNKTTNNRMEIAAVIEAIKYLYEDNLINSSITIYSDSQYVVNSINTWRHKWSLKNFNGIKNPDLWKYLHELLNPLPNIIGIWVKGHNGDPKNELVNSLAQKEAYKLKEVREVEYGNIRR